MTFDLCISFIASTWWLWTIAYFTIGILALDFMLASTNFIQCREIYGLGEWFGIYTCAVLFWLPVLIMAFLIRIVDHRTPVKEK